MFESVLTSDGFICRNTENNLFLADHWAENQYPFTCEWVNSIAKATIWDTAEDAIEAGNLFLQCPENAGKKTMNSILDFSKDLSHKLHSKQFRKNGVTPYSVHTDYVGDHAINFYNNGGWHTNDEFIIVSSVGYLHDTIEDVVTYEELINYGKDLYDIDYWKVICDFVRILSRDKNVDILTYLSEIKKHPVTTAVKLADLDHNMSDLQPSNLRDKYVLCRNYLKG